MFLPSNIKLGIIGGGQLGKMLAESAAPWNIYYNFLDNADAPCKFLAKNFIVGSLQSETDILALSNISDVISYEIEHVNTDVLTRLHQEGKKIIPFPNVLALIKDKGIQKQFLHDNGLPVPPFSLINKEEDWEKALDTISGETIVAKSRMGGYDGKGVKICTKEEIKAGLRPFDINNCMLETCVENALEISVIVAVGQDKEMKTFPPVQMEFDPVSNLVIFLHTALSISEELAEECKAISLAAVASLKSPGLFAVELFVDQEKQVWVNEIAPRPHNSGHHTIEACYTSQYEQLNRILLGFPLGNTDLIKPAAMLNLVGPRDFSGAYMLNNLEKMLSIPGIYVHLYGKNESKPDRKLGHITVIADTKEELFEKVELAKTLSIHKATR